MSHTVRLAPLLALALLLGAAGAKAAQLANAAMVNGEGIPRHKVDATLELMLAEQGIDVGMVQDSEQLASVRRQILDALITQELLWQEAEAKQLVASDAEVAARVAAVKQSAGSEESYRTELARAGFTEEQFVDDLRRQLSVERLINEEIAAGLSISDEEVHAFYEANTEQLTRPEQIHARHILVKVAPDADEAAKQDARKRIEAVLAEARKPGADFAELARKHSEGPSAPQGGDLGFVPKGRLVPEFEAAAWALNAGQISDVVETQFGYHVIELQERRPAQVAAEAEVSDRIRDHLRQQKSRSAVQERVRFLRERADVEILGPL
jgi:peptidyl-prolyl cis-trans isomerase C